VLRSAKLLQVSLANALHAITWVAVGAASYGFLARHSGTDLFARRPLDHESGGPGLASLLIYLIVAFLMFWAPVVALATLLGKTKRGMTVGAWVGIICLIVCILAVWSRIPQVYSGPRTRGPVPPRLLHP
jgi:hypothetical protein